MPKNTNKHTVLISAEVFEEARTLAMVLGISTAELINRAVRNEVTASERDDAPPEIRQAIQAVRLARRSYQEAALKRSQKSKQGGDGPG